MKITLEIQHAFPRRKNLLKLQIADCGLRIEGNLNGDFMKSRRNPAFDPEKVAAPHMASYQVEVEPTDLV
jgi:hypothetical protein